MRSRAFALALSLSLALVAAPALASIEDDLQKAETAYTNLEFAEATARSEAILKKGGLAREQLLRAYRVLALSDATLERDAPAREAFTQLLTLDPDFEIDPRLAPKIRQPYFEAKGYLRALSARPGVDASASVRPQEGGSIRVTLRDPTHVARKVVVGYRFGATGEMTTKTSPPQASSSVPVPPPPAGNLRVDYFTQVLDEKENVIFEAGSPAAPRTATMDPVAVATSPSHAGEPENGGGGSIFASPWFWVATGVVVAGAGTAIYFAARPGDTTETRPATTGILTPSLNCGLVACK